MDKNQIKKALYKEKTIARLHAKLPDCWYKYNAYVNSLEKYVTFIVPYKEMGTSIHRFKDEMPAHELIRWLITE